MKTSKFQFLWVGRFQLGQFFLEVHDRQTTAYALNWAARPASARALKKSRSCARASPNNPTANLVWAAAAAPAAAAAGPNNIILSCSKSNPKTFFLSKTQRLAHTHALSLSLSFRVIVNYMVEGV